MQKFIFPINFDISLHSFQIPTMQKQKECLISLLYFHIFFNVGSLLLLYIAMSLIVISLPTIATAIVVAFERKWRRNQEKKQRADTKN